jgi:hypothetical protein
MDLLSNADLCLRVFVFPLPHMNIMKTLLQAASALVARLQKGAKMCKSRPLSSAVWVEQLILRLWLLWRLLLCGNLVSSRKEQLFSRQETA